LLSQRSENIESLKNEVATLESQLSRANQQIQSLQSAVDEHSRYTEERRRWFVMLLMLMLTRTSMSQIGVADDDDW